MMPVSTSVDIFVRHEAYVEFLAEKGIPLDESKIIYADYTYEEAREHLKQICPTKNDLYFDAVATCSDDLAFGCIAYFREIGVSVPDDVAVTGFDNQRRCLYSNPELTSIDQQIDTQSCLAASLLEKRISDPNFEPKVITVPSLVKCRESCGCEKGKTVVVSSLFNTSYQYGYVAYTPGDVEPRMYELIFSATGIAPRTGFSRSKKTIRSRTRSRVFSIAADL